MQYFSLQISHTYMYIKRKTHLKIFHLEGQGDDHLVYFQVMVLEIKSSETVKTEGPQRPRWF